MSTVIGIVCLVLSGVVFALAGQLWRRWRVSNTTLVLLGFLLFAGFGRTMTYTDDSGFLAALVAAFSESMWSWWGVGLLAAFFVGESLGWYFNEKPIGDPNYPRPTNWLGKPDDYEKHYKSPYFLSLVVRELGLVLPRQTAKHSPPSAPEAKKEEPKLEPLRVPEVLQKPLEPFVKPTNRKAIEALMKYLPIGAIGPGKGIPIWKYLELRYTGSKDEQDLAALMERIGTKSGFFKTEMPIHIPDHLRTQHHHIVAGSGGGKSQCIQQMVLEDLKTDASIVVIDSQNDLINKLATRVPADRLILIDPEHCPPAIDLFNSDQDVTSATELYEYIFSALDAKLTSKQSLCYRFVSRLLMNVPNANIQTFREVLQPGKAYQEYAQGLGETVEAFFAHEYNRSQYKQTREEILRRLYTVLENDAFARMFSATGSQLDITKALDGGKVILINTAKQYMKQTAASLFGRFFIAQVMQSVVARQDQRRRTYLYIDEFQDYAEDSHVLFTLFEQARKYELGLIVAHQYLGQMPNQLQQSVAANTAIKFAGKVSSEDARKLGNQMRVRPEFIDGMPNAAFAADFRGIGPAAYGVEFGKLEQTPELTSLSSIRDFMRQLYGVRESVSEPGPKPSQRVSGPPDMTDDPMG